MMGMPKSAARIAAEALCKDFPDTATRTLAKRLSAEWSMTLEQARGMLRVIRGNAGEKNRRQATVKRKNGKAGTKPQMPPSLAEPWLPFELDARRIAILSDIHVPYHDERALATAVKWCKERKPDAVLLNGDIGDFYTVSRFQKNPKKRQFSKEMELLTQFIAWIRDEFPKARIVYKQGNHDERWDHWLWNHAPELSDLPQLRLDAMLELEKHGVEMVSDQRPVMLGLLPVLHGHECGRSGIANPVNPARGAFLRTNHTLLVGHSHQTSTHTECDMWKKDTVVWSTGCLCNRSPEYARFNKWNHGVADVEVYGDKSFTVTNARIGRDFVVRTA